MKVTRYTNDNGFFEMILKWFHFCMICFFQEMNVFTVKLYIVKTKR